MIKIKYDLHIHTTASDGLLEPKKVFQIAADKGLSGISITDHDTVAALDCCIDLSKQYDIEFIPGIELSCDYFGLEVHILGYYIDYKNVTLLNFLEVLQNSRYERAMKMVEIIKNLGYDISFSEVEHEAGSMKTIGRPHVGRVLVNKGYFKYTSEVFNELLSTGKPAYVDRYKVTVEDGINMIINSGGIPVVAHPMIIDGLNKICSLESFILEMKNYGAQGIEVYHSLHSIEDSKILYDIAQKLNMITTGGSDCHGMCTEAGYILGNYGVGSVEIEKLKFLKR